MLSEKEVARILIDNKLCGDYIDNEDFEYIEHCIQVYDDAICIEDVMHMTKNNLLKLEKLLGAKDFIVSMNGHMEYIYVIYKF